MSDYYERLVDEEALAAYLTEHLGEADEYAVSRHREGHSNETLFVTWEERDLVLRCPPPGETAETAHDVLREHAVTSALVDTEVPVPEPVLACDDHDVIGSDFYLMERLEGTVLRDEEPSSVVNPADRERIATELLDTLAAIHTVDYEAVGLGEFGRPEGYTQRQVDRWGNQIAWALERTAEERELPVLEEVGAWLRANVPGEHPHTLVHGDYKLDNVMFRTGGDPDDAPTSGDGGTDDPAEGDDRQPELIGVFDWEMSTLGDPRADLGWLLSHWWEPKDPEPAFPDVTPTFTRRSGYPSRRELVDRYEERTGIAFEHARFYRALAVYKLAALGEMFYRRYLEGNSDDPTYPKMKERVPALAQRAKEIVDGDRPL